MLNKFANPEDNGYKRVSMCLREFADKARKKQR